MLKGQESFQPNQGAAKVLGSLAFMAAAREFQLEQPGIRDRSTIFASALLTPGYDGIDSGLSRFAHVVQANTNYFQVNPTFTEAINRVLGKHGFTVKGPYALDDHPELTFAFSDATGKTSEISFRGSGSWFEYDRTVVDGHLVEDPSVQKEIFDSIRDQLALNVAGATAIGAGKFEIQSPSGKSPAEKTALPTITQEALGRHDRSAEVTLQSIYATLSGDDYYQETTRNHVEDLATVLMSSRDDIRGGGIGFRRLEDVVQDASTGFHDEGDLKEALMSRYLGQCGIVVRGGFGSTNDSNLELGLKTKDGHDYQIQFTWNAESSTYQYIASTADGKVSRGDDVLRKIRQALVLQTGVRNKSVEL